MKTSEVEYYCSLAMPEFCTMQTNPEGNRYVIEVVHWPNCAAAGKTRDEAAAALLEAKRQWLISRSKQGLDIPLPTQVMPQVRTLEAALDVAKLKVLAAAKSINVDLKLTHDDLAAMSLEVLVLALLGKALNVEVKQTRKQRRARRAANAN